MQIMQGHRNPPDQSGEVKFKRFDVGQKRTRYHFALAAHEADAL